MPAPSRFKTERGQRIAVATTAIAIFVAAMGAAIAYTFTHAIDHSVTFAPTDIEGLSLDLPVGWTPQQSPRPGVSLLEPVDNPEVRVRRWLGAYHFNFGSVQAPMDLMQTYWEENFKQKMSANPRPQQLQRFRNGSLIGIFYHDTHESSERVITRNYGLLFTEDARSFWLVAMRDQVTHTSARDEDNLKLLERIAQSAKVLTTRSATAADMARARLPVSLPSHLDARVEQYAPIGEPVNLVPINAGTGLSRLSVVGTIDTGVIDPTKELSPSARLSQQFIAIHGRQPNERELTSTLRDGHSVWRLTLNAGRAADARQSDRSSTLVRERYYARLKNGNGLLLDTLCEQSMYEATKKQVDIVIAAAADAPRADDASLEAASKRFVSAVRNGAALGKSMRSTVGERLREGWHFQKNVARGAFQSVRMTRWYRTDDADRPLWGRAIQKLAGRASVTLTAWHASDDGQRITSYVHNQRVNDKKLVNDNYQVQVDGDRITTVRNPNQDDRNRHIDIALPNYIPDIAEEVWPMAAVYNLAEQGPALVRRSQHPAGPLPCWIDATLIEKDIASGQLSAESAITHAHKGTVAVLTIRPIMGMETTRIWLDKDGHILHQTLYVARSAPTGGEQVDVISITRAEALKLDSSLSETIFLWLMENPDPGMQP